MKKFMVLMVMLLSVISLMAQPGARGFARIGMITPSEVIQGENTLVTGNRDWSAEAGYSFGKIGFMASYQNCAMNYSATDMSTLDASRSVVSTKMLGVSYLHAGPVKDRDLKGYNIYSLTGVGYGLGLKSDAAYNGFNGNMNWNYLAMAQDFSLYLDRNKRRTDKVAFSSINFRGRLDIPLASTVETISKVGVPENGYMPTLPTYFGSASLTPKFKLVIVNDQVVNMLVSGTYACRPYDFRPGASWYNIQLGISVDAKKRFAEIASIKLSVANGDLNRLSRVGGHSVELSLNLMAFFYRDARPTGHTPHPK